MSLENNLSLEKFEETMAGAINSCSNYFEQKKGNKMYNYKVFEGNMENNTVLCNSKLVV